MPDAHELITIPVDDRPFSFPRNLEGCVMGVLVGGEYAIPDVPDLSPIKHVLDIGGNVGAFAVWAHKKWPEASVTGYEPHPGCAELYRKNAPFAELFELALTDGEDGAKPAKLFVGTDWGMNSTFPGITQQTGESIWVEGQPPSILPPCDVLKVDAEGVEWVVLARYKHWPGVQVCLFEWHHEEDRRRCEDLCLEAGLRLFRADQPLNSIGRQHWLRSKAVYDHQERKYVLP